MSNFKERKYLSLYWLCRNESKQNGWQYNNDDDYSVNEWININSWDIYVGITKVIWEKGKLSRGSREGT